MANASSRQLVALLNGISADFSTCQAGRCQGDDLFCFLFATSICISMLPASVVSPLQPLDGNAPISHFFSFMCKDLLHTEMEFRRDREEEGRAQDGVPALMHVLSLGVTLGLRRGQRSSG